MYACKYFRFVGWFLLVNARNVPTAVKVNKYLTEANNEYFETCNLNSRISYSPEGKSS